MSKSIGSRTAKGGFNEEDFLVKKLNEDDNLRNRLSEFIDKNLNNDAKKIKGNYKSDIQISNINIQHKKTKLGQFGQLDRHYLDDLIKHIPELKTSETILRNLFELPIDEKTKLCDKTKNVKKLDNSNYSKDELDNLLNNIEDNKRKIIEYAFYGTKNAYIPELFSLSIFLNNERKKLIFFKLENIIDYLMKFKPQISKNKTVINISDGLTIQRKGGDNGKKEANNFQIKFIPTKLKLDNAFIYEL